MTEEKKVNIPVLKSVIKKPHLTEKATLLSEKNVYVFEVEKKANKTEVKKEIERIYKVKPVKVNIAVTGDEKVFVRGKWGVKRGIKKAYVYLKKGDKISVI